METQGHLFLVAKLQWLIGLHFQRLLIHLKVLERKSFQED